jgi:hypothetical protein
LNPIFRNASRFSTALASAQAIKQAGALNADLEVL